MSSPESISALSGVRVALLGKFGAVSKREALQCIRQHSGLPVELSEAELVVVGVEELPLASLEDVLTHEDREAVDAGELEVISETELWRRLGLLDSEPFVRKLYTPAMLADLVGAPLSAVRRWGKRGLIVARREVHRLPYYDFQEVATARRLAQLLAAGASPDAIEKKLEKMAQWLPDVHRPLSQLSVIVEGRDILLRQGDGLVETGGQLRFDFENAGAAESTSSVSMQSAESANASRASLEELAKDLEIFEAEGNLTEAAGVCRTLLAAFGPSAEINFQLAELLYREGDLPAARERYYMAIELDEDFVEARANLGCVLSELGDHELALAAFEGALARHDEYPDVHYHLARLYDDACFTDEAERHWSRFIALAPNSPWVEEARERLRLADESAPSS